MEQLTSGTQNYFTFERS